MLYLERQIEFYNNGEPIREKQQTEIADLVLNVNTAKHLFWAVKGQDLVKQTFE